MPDSCSILLLFNPDVNITVFRAVTSYTLPFLIYWTFLALLVFLLKIIFVATALKITHILWLPTPCPAGDITLEFKNAVALLTRIEPLGSINH